MFTTLAYLTRASCRRRVLLVLLLPLIVLASLLVFRVVEPHGYFVSIDPSRLTWFDLRFGNRKCFALTIDTGTLIEISPYENENLPKNLHGELVRFGQYVQLESKYIVEIIDPDTFKLKRKALLTLPTDPQLVGGRYAIACANNTIHCIDLDSDDLEPKLSSAPGFISWTGPQKMNIFGVFRSVRSLCLFEVFQINNDASLRVVATMPVLNECAVIDDQGLIHSISADGSAFEVHDANSGKRIDSIPVPVKYRTGYRQHGPRDGFFIFDAGTSFDLVWPNGGGLHFPFSTGEIYSLDASSEFDLLMIAVADKYGDGHVEIFDTKTFQPVFNRKQHSVIWAGTCFVNDHTLAVASKSHGLTVELIDFRTGRLIKRIAPFRWASWTLPILVALVTFWVGAWIRASVPENGWACGDVCLVASLLLVPMDVRMAYIHAPTDLNRIPLQYTQGILLGLFNISALWLATGTTRITLRLLPFLGCTTLLAGLLIAFFGPDDAWSWRGVLTTIAPSVGMCLLYRLLRSCGWKMFNTRDDIRESKHPSRAIPIRDFFLLTGCIAILLAVSRTLLPHFMLLFTQSPRFVILAIGLACLCGTTTLTMQPSRICRLVSTLGALVLLVLLTAYPAYEFSFGKPLVQAGFQDVVQTVASGSLATFVLLQPYRQRGWRASFR